MITEMWGENNWMINQIRSNTVAYYSWIPQDSILMFKASDEYQSSEFFMTFNNESRIYDINDKF